MTQDLERRPGPVHVLTETTLRKLLTMREAVEAVEEALRELARGQVSAPPKAAIDTDEGSLFVSMPAHVPSMEAAGVKWVASIARNAAAGLPTIVGTVLLSDPQTGRLQAICDAGWLTTLRTGAMVGVAARHLLHSKVPVVGFVGAGAQARSALRAVRQQFPDLERVQVSDIDPDRVASFGDDEDALLVERHAGAQWAVRGADLVVVATTSKTPVVDRAWLKAGARIVKIGSNRELNDDVLLGAGAIVVDELAQHRDRGELAPLLASGQLAPEAIYGELGEIVADSKPMPPAEMQVVACLLGVGVLDIVLAQKALGRARVLGRGLQIQMHG